MSSLRRSDRSRLFVRFFAPEPSRDRTAPFDSRTVSRANPTCRRSDERDGSGRSDGPISPASARETARDSQRYRQSGIGPPCLRARFRASVDHCPTQLSRDGSNGPCHRIGPTQAPFRAPTQIDRPRHLSDRLRSTHNFSLKWLGTHHEELDWLVVGPR